ncbi:hypothetical protein FE236_10110 [Mariprofundus erugo]|uniref:hypothetical protein n=1 Tax=Mariprofundus erugo TaxID=2528639 RepID=UPI0010FE5EA1|nr:hypothetical protein [Mariprofundus erugo]TLS75112.1 hypothetical protein FE236_10110 [Mariprofundus erugo]
MRLGDIAEILANVDTLVDGDIVMMAVGEGIGSCCKHCSASPAEMSPSKLVIRSSDDSLFDRLQAKQSEIKALGKGTALLRIFVSDLKELDI